MKRPTTNPLIVTNFAMGVRIDPLITIHIDDTKENE
jgi:hypothetical protein